MSGYVPFGSPKKESSKFVRAFAVVLAIAIAAAVMYVSVGRNAELTMASAIQARSAQAMRTIPTLARNLATVSKSQPCNTMRSFPVSVFELPDLPWEKESLSPHMSPETIDYHYGKHHAAYVNKLNDLTKGTDKESKSLQALIASETGGIFNSAAQAYNHEFFWKCLSPAGGGAPTGAIADAITRDFGSFDAFKDAYDKAAVGHFGSGWVWLAKDSNGKLQIIDTHDADNPLTKGLTPILTTDVWEHAYYVDYRNARPDYIQDGWWNLVNWDFANANYAA